MTAPRTCVHFSLYLPQASRGARDDKGEGGASIWCDGNNDNLMDAVHFSLNLPQASRGARDDKGEGDAYMESGHRTEGDSSSAWMGRQVHDSSVENVSLSGHGDGNGDGRPEGRPLQPIFITLGGPQAHDCSGRDDKFVAPARLNCRSLGYAPNEQGCRAPQPALISSPEGTT